MNYTNNLRNSITPDNKPLRKCQKNFIILVDMDSVLCDFETYFLDCYRKEFPKEPFIPLNERKGFYISDQYAQFGESVCEKTRFIFNRKGFFENLPPIPNSIDSLKDMSSIDNVEVFICTSPMKNYTYCTVEKYKWIEKYFGRIWVEKLILTRDKTLITGDLLIDDKPYINGAIKYPSWSHVLFQAHHNTDIQVPSKKTTATLVLKSWSDWRPLIINIKQKKF